MLMLIATTAVFCQVPSGFDYTDLAASLIAKYPWLAFVGYGLWFLSDYLGSAKWTKANGVIQFLKGLFFKKKTDKIAKSADLNPGKPGGNGITNN